MPPKAEVNSEHERLREGRDSSSETGAANHALGTQRLRMDRHQADAAEQDARRSACKRPSRAQWHLLDAAVGSALAIGCVRLSSAPCFRKRCCSRTVGTTRIGSGSLPDRKGHGQTFRRSEIAKTPICFSRYLYRTRNLVERFFNKIKQCRRVATRYDKLAANHLAFVKLASTRIWLRANESTP